MLANVDTGTKSITPKLFMDHHEFSALYSPVHDDLARALRTLVPSKDQTLSETMIVFRDDGDPVEWETYYKIKKMLSNVVNPNNDDVELVVVRLRPKRTKK
jgi:hypothetical protein